MSLRMRSALFLGVVFVGLLGFKLVHDTDIFWQVKLGQIMLEEGRIPFEIGLTYTHAGETVPADRLARTGLARVLYNVGGWRPARLFITSPLVWLVVVAASTCRPRSHVAVEHGLIAMTIGFVVTALQRRPSASRVLVFSALQYSGLCRGRLPLPSSWSRCPILVAWQNMHPSVVVGALALGGLAAADFLDRTGTRAVSMADGRAHAPCSSRPTGHADRDRHLRRVAVQPPDQPRRLGACGMGSPLEPEGYREAVDLYWVAFGRIADRNRLAGDTSHMRDRCCSYS